MSEDSRRSVNNLTTRALEELTRRSPQAIYSLLQKVWESLWTQTEEVMAAECSTTISPATENWEENVISQAIVRRTRERSCSPKHLDFVRLHRRHARPFCLGLVSLSSANTICLHKFCFHLWGRCMTTVLNTWRFKSNNSNKLALNSIFFTVAKKIWNTTVKNSYTCFYREKVFDDVYRTSMVF